MQKEKVNIDCEKGTQISIFANKIATQWWPNNIIKESKQTIHFIYFLFSYYVADLIKKLELYLMVVSVLLNSSVGVIKKVPLFGYFKKLENAF